MRVSIIINHSCSFARIIHWYFDVNPILIQSYSILIAFYSITGETLVSGVTFSNSTAKGVTFTYNNDAGILIDHHSSKSIGYSARYISNQFINSYSNSGTGAVSLLLGEGNSNNLHLESNVFRNNSGQKTGNN